jgi:hypothetical protein
VKKKVETCPATEHNGYIDIPIQVDESLGLHVLLEMDET